VVAQIDDQLTELDRRLEGYEELVAERRRLVTARRALTGESPPPGPGDKRLSQEQVADYLREHPGSRAGEIAQGLGVSPAMVSAHLFRGKGSRFVRREDGWHVA
jgi:hypothetical protein